MAAREKCGRSGVSRSEIGALGWERVRFALEMAVPSAQLVERRAGITLADRLRGALTKRCS